jgi:hypothetical protein
VTPENDHGPTNPIGHNAPSGDPGPDGHDSRVQEMKASAAPIVRIIRLRPRLRSVTALERRNRDDPLPHRGCCALEQGDRGRHGRTPGPSPPRTRWYLAGQAHNRNPSRGPSARMSTATAAVYPPMCTPASNPRSRGYAWTPRSPGRGRAGSLLPPQPRASQRTSGVRPCHHWWASCPKRRSTRHFRRPGTPHQFRGSLLPRPWTT